MNRISSVFQKNRHKALIAYITVGYPSMQATLDAASLLAEEGCDMIELGIPFSDPLADGVTIQKATHQALLNGVSVKKCLEAAGQIREKVDIPLLFMGYLNPMLHYGLKEFCSACFSAGVDGLIIPDLPPGELPELSRSTEANHLDLISFIAPNSSDERIKHVVLNAKGFIYMVSVTGVTGTRDSLAADLKGFISRVRKHTSLPLCIGFGISNARQAKQAAAIADGVIIGSRIIQLMEAADTTNGELRRFVRDVRAAIDSA